ncbi:Mu transposase C-terminal domain-containing protein [Niabella sp. W65]|nr:Mu transposase C-terminal domain-containing protein [Niabella sp. W65]MCH7368502.1 Mu transposase C-terminal domain-containing protein [Niabella sp. W65]ULT44092.1 Mu transposase C-terminal domain-containing protein [Niabella sp. I65]
MGARLSYTFYSSIAKWIPPAHGNKHRAYIEPMFGRPTWKRAQQLISLETANWTGNNISSKYRGVNIENVSAHARVRPLLGDESELQIENMFHLMRNMRNVTKKNFDNAITKEQEFLQKWANMSDDEKRPITDLQMLSLFGVKHEPDGRTIRITNRGIEPQIMGQKFSYDLPEAWMYNKLIGAQVNVVFDPFDMSRVLITNDDDIRFVAQTAQLSARSIQDYTTGSRTFLNALLAEKKEQVRTVAEMAERRKELVDKKIFNPAAVLAGGSLRKELKNDVEHIAEIEQYMRTDDEDADDLFMSMIDKM